MDKETRELIEIVRKRPHPFEDKETEMTKPREYLAWASRRISARLLLHSLPEAKAWCVDYLATRLDLGGDWATGVDDVTDPDNPREELLIIVAKGRVKSVRVPDDVYEREETAPDAVDA